MKLIDADALLDDLMERYCKACDRRKGIKSGKWRVIYEIGEAPCRACAVGDMMDELEETSSAERTGHWIMKHPMRYDGKFLGYDVDEVVDTRIYHLYCSECDTKMPYYERFPFCPYCGCRMKGEEE